MSWTKLLLLRLNGFCEKGRACQLSPSGPKSNPILPKLLTAAKAVRYDSFFSDCGSHSEEINLSILARRKPKEATKASAEVALIAKSSSIGYFDDGHARAKEILGLANTNQCGIAMGWYPNRPVENSGEMKGR